MEIIQEQINRITAKGEAKLSFAFAASLGLALWSANAGMKAVIDAETLLRFLRWPLLLCLVIFGLAVLYRFGPSRESPRWEWLTAGSVFARNPTSPVEPYSRAHVPCKLKRTTQWVEVLLD